MHAAYLVFDHLLMNKFLRIVSSYPNMLEALREAIEKKFSTEVSNKQTI